MLTSPTNPTATDAEAIARLKVAFATQKAAFQREPFPSAEQRAAHLSALAQMVVANRERIRAALSDDFAVHPEPFSDLIETIGVAARVAYAAEHVAEWMAPEPRDVDPALFGTARAEVRYQPKGVIGTVVPWNFPFELSLGPLADMLAAGNRVVIKPSEYTPACGRLLADMIAETFEPELVTVVEGGVELAQALPTLAWDHLLYTGNPAVGRKIAVAAAQNLVPLTLELGGKCPAIVADDAVNAETVKQILGTKMIKNGQMCISVDYCLVPRERLADFVDLAQAHMQGALAGYSSGPDCTGIITERHLDRLLALLDEARGGGAHVIQLDRDGQLDRDTRRMPLSLVVDPDERLGIMREEIFGPILPVKAYDTLYDAIAYVNGGERPLGLYAFSADPQTAERILERTVSGGACVNTCVLQGALPALGFGGSGMSGNGRHHGIDGFREFSNPRGVVVRGDGDLVEALFPPYGELTAAVIAAALGGQ